jgi:predicted nucleic acid-binding protein
VILADTSVWAGHLREGDAELARRLEAAQVVCHPWVIAELALGTLKARETVLGLLDGMPALPVASANELRAMVEARGLAGSGIGFVDAGLVASCLLVPGTMLWTRDRRLGRVAEGLEVAWSG